MKPVEKPLVFKCEGDRLIGVLTLPAAPSPFGVLIIVGGPQYRVGSHRQFVQFARALASEGYPALRFDYRGMGDSEGALRIFEDVEPDIRAAVRAFREACPTLRKLVLYGLCDAASAALMMSDPPDELAGLILVNPWVRRNETLNAAVVRHYYTDRIVSAQFWRKLVSGKVPVRSAASEFVARVRRFITARKPGDDAAIRDFVDRMRLGWQRPVRKLLLLSGRDITAREFEDVRSGDIRWSLAGPTDVLEEARFVDADHTFSTAESQRAATARCICFLAQLRESSVRDGIAD